MRKLSVVLLAALAVAGCAAPSATTEEGVPLAANAVDQHNVPGESGITPIESSSSVRAPSTPVPRLIGGIELQSPSDYAEGVDPDGVVLRWTNPWTSDGSPIRFYVDVNGYAECENENPCVLDLEHGEDYDWFVVVDTEWGERAESETFTFSTLPEYRIYIAQPPTFPGGPSSRDIKTALSNAVDFWEGSDLGLVRVVSTKSDANVYGEYVKEWADETRLGVAFGSDILQVGLGNSDCNGKWTPFDAITVEMVMTHEIGHILGLEHSGDPNDIMYPTTRNYYNVPCEWAAGSRDFETRTSLTWTFDAPEALDLWYDFEDRDDGKLMLCIKNRQGESCSEEKLNSIDGVEHVPRGESRITVYCQNYFDPCRLDYTIAYDYIRD